MVLKSQLLELLEPIELLKYYLPLQNFLSPSIGIMEFLLCPHGPGDIPILDGSSLSSVGVCLHVWVPQENTSTSRTEEVAYNVNGAHGPRDI